MARPKKEYDKFNCRLSKDISKQLEKFCADTRFTKTAVVERALECYFQQFRSTGKI